jgi:3-methyladenine DNA glycosylase/8-oxoguanine DNA glycosylase
MARSPFGTAGAAVGSTLAAFRYGHGDPTTRLAATEFWRATLTPQGPATLHLDWSGGELASRAWGDGSEWMLSRVSAMTGALDPGHEFTDAHPAIMRAQRNHPGVRFGASGTLYHELLPTVLGQRITAGEALAQWRRLVEHLGSPAPGPASGLLLPPEPAVLAARPAWWFHPLGIEAKRAETLRLLARRSSRLGEWSELEPVEAAAKLQLLDGLGPWTIGSVMGVALGDTDAVPFGDFHLKNIIAHVFTGRARGTDEEMHHLLAPYTGQRGRVVRLLLLDGHSAPAFGPRRRVLPVNRY